MPSFGLLVVAAIVASSCSICLLERSASLASSLYAADAVYYASQKLMLVSSYISHNANGSGAFMDALDLSLGLDGFSAIHANSSEIIVSGQQNVYYIADPGSQHQNS
jgi:hypothetical protein